MDLQKAKDLAINLMQEHGLIDSKWYFRFNNRRRSAGVCSYRNKSIELSKHITAHADEHEVRDTILHEIAHALVGEGHGHDSVWVRKAKSIGCNGLRCYDEKSKPSTSEAYRLIAKYKGFCPNGHNHFRNRMPKKSVSCGLCSSKYNPDYLVVYSPNL
jgi:predicted SprT family Zn-dependent metalloprotease